jgi:hypothetical protein
MTMLSYSDTKIHGTARPESTAVAPAVAPAGSYAVNVNQALDTQRRTLETDS